MKASKFCSFFQVNPGWLDPGSCKLLIVNTEGNKHIIFQYLAHIILDITSAVTPKNDNCSMKSMANEIAQKDEKSQTAFQWMPEMIDLSVRSTFTLLIN